MKREEEEGAGRGEDNVSWGFGDKCAGLGGDGSPPTQNSFREAGVAGAVCASKEEVDSAVRSVISVSLPEDAAAAI